ncbi:pilus assembly FimT family protein [Alkanindiges illinoisensis]|nr:GspH/FimT family pseudopilin [Alkanindiges illinoisensis]
MQSRRGFTLVELMVTIAVVAILAMIAAPSFTVIIARQQLNKAVRDLGTTLSEARSQAILLRKDVTLTLNSAAMNTKDNFYWQPYSDYSTDDVNMRAKNNKLTSTTTTLTFTYTGAVKNTTTDTDFVVCNPIARVSKTLSVSRSGIQIYKADGTCS